MKKLVLFCTSLVLLFFVEVNESHAQQKRSVTIEQLASQLADQNHDFDIVVKKLEDVLWFEMVGDVAYIDKVRLTGPPKYTQIPTGNPFHDALLDNNLVFFSYVFIPKTVKKSKRYPLVVFAHGGIHGTFSTLYSHVVRELMAQGYIVVAPDYRGRTGYGKGFYQSIDYGGLENEDVLASCMYMIENYSMVDSKRVGILGWSHGGMITLMNVCRYPDVYACGYAGVPVSDVTYRLEYQEPAYTDNFTAPYHIGKTPQEDPAEYARRSPVSYAKDLRIPLMITTAENDDDVSVKEVQRMIDSLTYYKKDFEYKIYGPMPGAHLFERIDTKEATDIRYDAYEFLARYLFPPKPFRSVKEMRKAGYRFN